MTEPVREVLRMFLLAESKLYFYCNRPLLLTNQVMTDSDVIFIYIHSFGMQLFLSRAFKYMLFPRYWTNFDHPLSGCRSLLLKSNQLSVFHQIPEKHSPCSIAQKGPISKPCPLQLAESGIDPFVSGQVSGAFV